MICYCYFCFFLVNCCWCWSGRIVSQAQGPQTVCQPGHSKCRLRMCSLLGLRHRLCRIASVHYKGSLWLGGKCVRCWGCYSPASSKSTLSNRPDFAIVWEFECAQLCFVFGIHSANPIRVLEIMKKRWILIIGFGSWYLFSNIGIPRSSPFEP